MFVDVFKYLEEYRSGIHHLKQNAIEVYRKHLGRHPFCATVLCFLGDLYLKVEEYQKASKQFFLACKMRRQWLGDHVDTMRSLVSYGKTLSKISQYAEAKERLTKAVEMGKRVLGNHLDVYNAINELAFVCEQLEAGSGEKYHNEAEQMKGKFVKESKLERYSSVNLVDGPALKVSKQNSFTKKTIHISKIQLMLILILFSMLTHFVLYIAGYEHLGFRDLITCNYNMLHFA